ncbi:bacterioferritin [Scytonema tolypothrichoides VB-61278]|nr:bacterioferritin [Scytonema tolypothrichoides VB-61278]
MQELDQKQTINLLNEIIECELSGVVRYTQYSLMVTGPYRITIVDFLKEQASESLLHAQKVGEILTGFTLSGAEALEGRPSLQILPADETDKYSVKHILAQSLAHEEKALRLYKNLLETVTNSSLYLEQFARNMIGEEEMHNIELKKMLRDFTE